MAILITEQEIKEGVEDLAIKIFYDYLKKDINTINFIFILDGSFIFASDLARSLSKLGMKLNISSLKVYSYEGVKSDEVIIGNTSKVDITYDHTLIVDDILDTGKTLKELWYLFTMKLRVKHLEICCLLKKNHDRCILDKGEYKEAIKINYIGFNILDQYIIGYGLDYKGLYRELSFIRDLNFTER